MRGHEYRTIILGNPQTLRKSLLRLPQSHRASKPIPIPKQLPSKIVPSPSLVFTAPFAGETATAVAVVLALPSPAIERDVVELVGLVRSATSFVYPGAVTAVGYVIPAVMLSNWLSASRESVA